jgi:uncharacterized membrane protein
MTGQLFNSSSQNQESNQSRGIADILALLPRQRKLINYIRRNKKSSFDDLVNHSQENPQTVEKDLEELIIQGFLNIEIIEGNRYYSFEFGQRQSSQMEITESPSVPGQPLTLIINPSGDTFIEAGSTFILRVSVVNQGGQNALIYLRFDETCDLIQKIAGYIEPQSVALNPGQSHELTFSIPIPTDTLTGFYDYRLEVDAPSHYPEETPIFHTANLQVRPYLAETEQVGEPFFVVMPNTTSTNPWETQPGESIAVEIEVYNRSDQVDRFRLVCTDLPDKWYKVTYPEGLPLPGLVINTDGLELNPGENKTIKLTITPPEDALAQIYAPTLKVYSENKIISTDGQEELKTELVMLDLFYFKVKAIYQLEATITTRRGTIKTPTDTGEYELKLVNKGNTPRYLQLEVDEGNTGKYCEYSLSLSEFTLNPNTVTRIRLDVLPLGKWKRQFYPMTLNFGLDILDKEEIEIPNEHFEGYLIVEGRPWWQFLLLILTILGTVGALIFLIWWLFIREKPLPTVISFNSASVLYKEANNDVIRLNWEITEARRIKTLTVNGYYKDGSPIAKPVIYDFTNGLPEELKEQCTFKRVLECNGIITNARKSEEYTFELVIVTSGKKRQVIKARTNPITIDATPLPEILEFTSTQPIYEEARAIATPQGANPQAPQQLQGQIILNWSVNFADQLKELTLVGKNKDGVVVSPLLRFAIRPAQDPKTLAPKTELCIIQDDKILGCNTDICTVQNQFQNEVLVCNGFPTGIKQPGEYTFELTPIPKRTLENPLLPKLTDIIKILPLPIRILSFQIQQNGQVLPDLPKYPFYINPNTIDPANPPMLIISWKVDGGEDVKVELSPSPGTVVREGKIPYFINNNPTSETITLTATNGAGDQVSRSFVIETIIPPQLSQDGGQNGAGANGQMPPPPGANGQMPSVPTLEPPPMIQPPDAPGSAGTPPTPPGAGETPSTAPPASTVPPRPPEAPGSTPPIPPDRNSPPPAELPPKIQ